MEQNLLAVINQPSSGLETSKVSLGDEKEEEDVSVDGEIEIIEPSSSLPSLKKKGRQIGAKKYSQYDEKALLEAVEKVLPSCEKDWNAVAATYNKDYAGRCGRTTRSENALRSRFRELAWGDASGGGERTVHQQLAKKIMGDIDKKNGTVCSDEKIVVPNLSSSSGALGEDTTNLGRGKGGANQRFRKEIKENMKESLEIEKERFAFERQVHEDMMGILKEFLNKI